MWLLKTKSWGCFDSRNRRRGVCHHLYKADDLLMQREGILFTEKLYLSLYYVCTELRHYLLSSTCVVVCQTDVIKYMLQKPILSGRIGKWTYALVEYDLLVNL